MRTWDSERLPDYAELCEPVDLSARPVLDRPDGDAHALTPEQSFWRENGYLILRNAVPNRVIDRFVRLRTSLDQDMGWKSPIAYTRIPKLREVCMQPSIMTMIDHLIGDEMALHLSLTYWKSPDRRWHSDDCLNQEFVNGHFVGVWFCLEDIHPDSGPFQFVAGSHRWPIMRGHLIENYLNALPPDRDPNRDTIHWTLRGQHFVGEVVAAEIARREAQIESFLGRKGDALVFHSCLAHRAQLARDPARLRKTVVSHYSATSHRPDFFTYRTHRGRKYFWLDVPLNA